METNSRKGSIWTWILIALIGVPMLYVFSLGPAFKYAGLRTVWHSTDGSAASSVFWPIIRCCEKSELIDSLMADYLGLWAGETVRTRKVIKTRAQLIESIERSYNRHREEIRLIKNALSGVSARPFEAR